MFVFAIVWIIPGGAVISAMIVKLSHKTRPSAFQNKKSEEPKTDEEKYR